MNEDEEERDSLIKTLNSYGAYETNTFRVICHARVAAFHGLARESKALLPDYLSHMKKIELAILTNHLLCREIYTAGVSAFGAETDVSIAEVDPLDLERTWSTLKLFWRDWSKGKLIRGKIMLSNKEGAEERKKCYSPILDALSDLYPKCENVKVLVPGAGLARLAYEIAKLGFETQANEFSFHMLIASNYVLNNSRSQMPLYPFIHSFNHWANNDAQLSRIMIPDEFPSSAKDLNFSMAAGDFTEIYETAQFDVVVTCFFLDTARDVTLYVRLIHRMLPSGGRWINFGPCLWHFGVELSLAEVVELVQRVGFVIDKYEQQDCEYIKGNSLWTSKFGCGFWIARKP